MESKHILLVEDDEFLREIYSDTIQNNNFVLSVAVDGEDAYTQIKTGKFDLILLDIILPKMTGLEVAKKLISEKFVFSCPVVFLSNIDNQSEMNDAMKIGRDYLVKSQMTPGEFIKKVNTYFQKA